MGAGERQVSILRFRTNVCSIEFAAKCGFEFIICRSLVYTSTQDTCIAHHCPSSPIGLWCLLLGELWASFLACKSTSAHARPLASRESHARFAWSTGPSVAIFARSLNFVSNLNQINSLPLNSPQGTRASAGLFQLNGRKSTEFCWRPGAGESSSEEGERSAQIVCLRRIICFKN